jgi:hypothetical protein
LTCEAALFAFEPDQVLQIDWDTGISRFRRISHEQGWNGKTMKITIRLPSGFLLILIVFGLSHRVLKANEPAIQGYSKDPYQILNRSTGTWRDLQNPWDYFPSSDIAGRQEMLRFSADLYYQIIRLESKILPVNERKPEKVLIERVVQLRIAVKAFHQIILYGGHRGDLADALATMQVTFGNLQTSLGESPQYSKEIENMAMRLGKIQNVIGPRLVPDD